MIVHREQEDKVRDLAKNHLKKKLLQATFIPNEKTARRRQGNWSMEEGDLLLVLWVFDFSTICFQRFALRICTWNWNMYLINWIHRSRQINANTYNISHVPCLLARNIPILHAASVVSACPVAFCPLFGTFSFACCIVKKCCCTKREFAQSIRNKDTDTTKPSTERK